MPSDQKTALQLLVPTSNARRPSSGQYERRSGDRGGVRVCWLLQGEAVREVLVMVASATSKRSSEKQQRSGRNLEKSGRNLVILQWNSGGKVTTVQEKPGVEQSDAKHNLSRA